MIQGPFVGTEVKRLPVYESNDCHFASYPPNQVNDNCCQHASNENNQYGYAAQLT